MDFGILASVLAVVTALSVVLAGLALGTTRTLRDSNGDLRNRVADLEGEREARDQADARRSAEIAAERERTNTALAERDTEIAILRGMVEGRVEWVAVSDLLEQHHRDSIKHWDTTEGLVRALIEVFQDKNLQVDITADPEKEES